MRAGAGFTEPVMPAAGASSALRRALHTSSSRWLKPRCSNVTIPWSGRDFDSRAATTSDSPCRVSPANMGAGNVDLLEAEVGDGRAVRGLEHRDADEQAEGEEAVHERTPELGAGRVLGVEVEARRVQRHGGEEDVVGLGDRAGERVRHDEADGQLLEPPSVMRRVHSDGLLVLVGSGL